MNHLPYKDWLLSEDPLSAEQASLLQDHLQVCQSCQQLELAWKDVNALFQKTQSAEPLPGFATRWQTRLAAHHLRKQRRLAWILVGAFSGIAALLTLFFGAQLLNMLNSPGNLILVWVSQITGIVSIYWAIENIFTGLAGQIPSLSWLVLVLGVGIVSFLSVLWLATYRKLTISRRLV